jgi:DNA polymerase III epsilon subunit-like protein
MASQPGDTAPRFLALRDRAYAFVVEHQPVAEDALLAHTYGGRPPSALHAQLAAPLLDDPRLERSADGAWTSAGRGSTGTQPAGGLDTLPVTALALASTGPSPDSGRVVCVAAEHVRAGETVERFSAVINPGERVPGYIAERLGLAPALLNDLPPFSTILDDLVQFLGTRPVVAQDARLTWAFLDAEARRLDRILIEPVLLDANDIATRLLDLRGKPTLALVAARFGIGTVRIGRPEEEARVLAQVTTRLMAIASQQGCSTCDALVEASPRAEQTTLRRDRTAQSLPDEPGVYVMRDANQAALYVGKARRLRSRVAAYVNRPLGATRRLEGLVGSVGAVNAIVCATDLEALILEDREIRRLQPRFNTVRRQRTPRVWIRLPPSPARRPGARQPAPRRLEPSLGPGSVEGEFVGPFRNQTLAERARRLARDVFDLDGLRRTAPHLYEHRLRLAWDFLMRSDTSGAQPRPVETYARQRSSRLVREVLAFDLDAALLPADPRQARYAVVRPGPNGIEGCLIDRGILRAWSVMLDDDASLLALELLAPTPPRTTPDDIDIVLRWMGAQRPPARLAHLADDPLAAADAIEDAALALADWLREA